MAFTPDQEKNIAEVAAIANWRRVAGGNNAWQDMYAASIQANQKCDALTAKVDALTALVQQLVNQPSGGIAAGTTFSAVVS